MLHCSNERKRRHTEACRVIRFRSKSDTENGDLSSQQPWRGMLVWGSKLRARHDPDEREHRRKPCDDRKVNIRRRANRCKLRTLICFDFCLAAAHLHHIAAVAVHCTAAGTLFLVHRLPGHAGEQRSCREEQDENRDETSEAAHFLKYIPLGL